MNLELVWVEKNKVQVYSFLNRKSMELTQTLKSLNKKRKLKSEYSHG